MQERTHYAYFETEPFQCIGIPYEDDEFSMVVILPKERYGLAELLKTIELSRILNKISKAEKADVDLSFPRFKTEASLNLKTILKRLGLIDGFDEFSADFSGISDMPLYISDVVHKAIIHVSLFVIIF